MVALTGVQQFAYFQVQESTAVIENRRIYNVAYVVTPLEEGTFTEGYLQIDASTDLSTITADTYVNDFFREGLQTLTLVNVDAVTIDDMRNYIAVRNYSLVFSPEVDKDIIPPETLGEFDGLKYYSYLKSELVDAQSKALIIKNVVCIDDYETDQTALANRLVSRFIIGNQTEKANQVAPFSDKTAVVLLSEVPSYRASFLTFLIQDDVTLPTPSLAYFIGGGGEPVPSYYIFERIKNEIETRITTIIATMQPKYINEQLSSLETEGQIIINKYIPALISTGSLSIPRKSEQTQTDIKAGFVKNATLNLSTNSDIWYVTGYAQKTIDYASEFNFPIGGN